MFLLMRILEGLCGVLILTWMLADIFQSVVVPRAVGLRLRLSPFIARWSWKFWRRLSWRIRDAEIREDFLAIFAPGLLILFLVTWMAGLCLGFGLCFFALREQVHPVPSLLDAIYFGGSTLFTLGFGDYLGVGRASRLLSLLTAGTGVATVAIATAFLFSLFGAFQRRETFIVPLGHSAGAPPSGLQLLATYARFDIIDDLALLMRESQVWAAEVMESHLAYPILMYFRSSHQNESWVASLGALLDAATLLATTVDHHGLGQANLFIDLATHVTRDLRTILDQPLDSYVGVEHHEFLQARAELESHGYKLFASDRSWELFQVMRRRYASSLNTLAQYFQIPPAQWIGDRSIMTPTMVRHKLI